MGYFIKNDVTTKSNFVHVYSGISKDELDKKIDQLLVSSGYTMKEGQIGHAVYAKGNRVMRILFGAFVKYFKFTIVTGGSSDSDEIKLAVRQESSGMSGGLIGMNQVKNELIRLGQILQTI
jgi:hypothetical protein